MTRFVAAPGRVLEIEVANGARGLRGVRRALASVATLASAATLAFVCVQGASAAPAVAPAATAVPFPSASASASASASPAAGPLLVRGRVLSTSGGFLAFTNGYAVALAPAANVPAGVTIGSYVRAFVDRTSRTVVALELEPRTNVTGEIDAEGLPREYLALGPRSIPPPVPRATAAVANGASRFVTVRVDVRVPANTPTYDDVYLSTDRSNFSSAEVRMTRLDARTFTVSVGLESGSKLRYTFTRGTQSSAERDRTGGIVAPRGLVAAPGVAVHDVVARWADIV